MRAADADGRAVRRVRMRRALRGIVHGDSAVVSLPARLLLPWSNLTQYFRGRYKAGYMLDLDLYRYLKEVSPTQSPTSVRFEMDAKLPDFRCELPRPSSGPLKVIGMGECIGNYRSWLSLKNKGIDHDGRGRNALRWRAAFSARPHWPHQLFT
ncbi:hypothetical protein BD626DRAFT_496020, partial [Schizophyllum amplum]